ncbi:uncharacterized protein MYCFIDRAFT_47042 [Pseudocercospora fijiensis CIRAD86]|uniref:Amidase domain-containing protein n=1 Tax=Pseudocercospora fijiensis (strain CIRAD86) TaxID=383855 RepID=M2ZX97_PSEFD|nr:uncharacterized protein MYCFIDRAFT_47042 [Pseudocercospora fijiensis CIRAD86]EME83614.1 hypothetical protein MYCFIDRAFT_47042 [Pseudocercospora fijiensis CIRAD86]
MDAHLESYMNIAARAQHIVLDSIPQQWRLSAEAKARAQRNPKHGVFECSILSRRQIRITELSASELLQKIYNGRLSSYEVTVAFCARAAIAHQLVNCLVDFFPEEALAQAKALDDDFARMKRLVGELHGLPLAVKDDHFVKGKVVTMGYTAWVSNPPCLDDSSQVKIMKDAGVIIFARTCMPQTGMALETVSNLWGPTLNSHDINFGAGRSSGGDGTLVALRGTPAAPLATDIGGSIRAPAGFNGCYGMRPTAVRVPLAGTATTVSGDTSIKCSAGPIATSLEDLQLFSRLLLTHPTIPDDPSAIIGYWNDRPQVPSKLRIGVWSTDGVVDPHPPVQRALGEATAKLTAAGHEIVDFKFPFDLWQAAQTAWALYLQTGAREHKAILQSADEPAIAQFSSYLNTFHTRELSVPELFAHNTAVATYKSLFHNAWEASGIDCIMCPSASMAGVPHNFSVWWEYTAIWNLLDYPSIFIPLKEFKISAKQDPKDLEYQPRDDPFDGPNRKLYDPEIWKSQPMTLQIVGRPCRDEGLTSVCEVLDRVVNADQQSRSEKRLGDLVEREGARLRERLTRSLCLSGRVVGDLRLKHIYYAFESHANLRRATMERCGRDGYKG